MIYSIGSTLYITKSAIPSFDTYPHLEKIIIVNYNGLTLPPLPSTLKTLIISDSQIENLPELPEGLETLIVTNHHLKNIPPVPNDKVKVQVNGQYIDYKEYDLSKINTQTGEDNNTNYSVKNKLIYC